MQHEVVKWIAQNPYAAMAICAVVGFIVGRVSK